MCTTLREFYTHRNLDDRRKVTKDRVGQVASDVASHSRTCEADIIVDDQTNAMVGMTIAMCGNEGIKDTIGWKKLEPFRGTLRRLHVQKNDFATVSMDDINRLTALEEFVLSNNPRLTRLDSLPLASTLHTLRIVRNGGRRKGGSGGKMEIGDMSISTLTALVHLQVCNCRLPQTGVPIDVFNFPSLRTVDISNNEGGETNISNARWSKSLQRITLNATQLVGTPSSDMFTSAKDVSVSNNWLTGAITMDASSKTDVLMASNNSISALKIHNASLRVVNISSQNVDELLLDMDSIRVTDTIDVSRNGLCIAKMTNVTCGRLVMDHLDLRRGLMVPSFDSLVLQGSDLCMINMHIIQVDGGVNNNLKTHEHVSPAVAHLLVRQPLAMIIWLVVSGGNSVTDLVANGIYRKSGDGHNITPVHAAVMRKILESGLGKIPDNITMDRASRSGLKAWFGDDDQNQFTFLDD